MYHEKTILHLILFLASFIGVSFGQSTDDCGKKYGCFLSPSGCQNSSCDYTVKWAKLNDNSIQFIIGTPADYESYLAIGFSYDQIMGNDSVALCKLSNAVNVSTVETYFDNKKHSKPEIVNSTYRSIGVSSMSVSYTDGRLVCAFQRQIRNDSFGPKFFDLNRMYYLLVAKGPLKSSYEPAYHDDATAYSSKQIDFRKVNNEQVGDQLFTKLHAFIKGIIMLFAWMILSTIGVLIARYFKTIYSDKKPCGVDFWFAVHRSFMVCVPILTIIGFLTVFYEKNWTFVEPGFTKSFIHALFGTLTLLMALVQPVVASFRPGKNDRSRPLFNWFHRIIGIGSFVFSHVAIFLGVYIYINSLIGWTIVTIWLFWLVLLVFVIEINTRFVISDEEDYLINHDASQNEVKNRKVEKKAKINSIMFIVHIIIAALVFSALLSFIIADL